MEKRWALIVLVSWVTISMVPMLCHCWGQEAMDNAKERLNLAAGSAKVKAAEAMEDAKESGGSWADWARDKLSE